MVKCNKRTLRMDEIKYITIHHTASDTDTFDSVNRYHTKTRGYECIGYNWFVERDGTVKEGRGYKVGAHAGPENNTRSVGVCFAGNYMTKEPSFNQYYNGAERVAQILVDTGLPFTAVTKHKDMPAASTACPGDKFNMTTLMNMVELHYLNKVGILNSPYYWAQRLDEPIPVWAYMSLIRRVIQRRG